MSAWYRTGTVEATNASATVTGTTTAWINNAKVGDIFVPEPDGRGYEITAINSNTEIEISPVYAGTTGSGKSYGIGRVSTTWNSVSELAVDVAEIVALSQNIISGEGVPDNELGSDGDRYFRTDDPEYYVKASGMWGTAIDLVGPTGATGATGATGSTGPAGTIAIGTVTTGTAGSSAAVANSGTSTAAVLDFTIPRGNTGATGATGPQGAAATIAVGTVTTLDPGDPATVTNTGTSGAAVFDIGIPQGDTGATGAAGTSFTPQGDYDGGTEYDTGDVVRDQDASWAYINATASTGNAPPTLPTTSDTYWQLLVVDGVDGSGAVDSVNGETGAVVLDATMIDISALTPASYTPAGTSVEQHLSGIDSALATAGSNPNVLINGDGAIAQRPSLSSIADDAYHVDRWYALTQTAAINVSQLANVTDSVPSMVRLTQSNASAQRIGSAQIVESVNSRVYRGQSVTFSGKVRCSTSSDVRFAILEWTGTADTVTSDVVLSWTSTTYAASGFFLASSVTVTAVDELAVTANTLADFEITGTVSSSCNNLIVMIWSEGTLAQTATLDFRGKLEIGSRATALVQRPYAQEYALSKRYFEYIDVGTAFVAVLAGRSTSIGQGVIYYAEKRTLPTVEFAQGSTYWDLVGVGGETISASYPLAEGIGLMSCSMRADLTSTALTGKGAYLMQGKAGSYITIDAEL